jgi:hypothetical protein
LPNLYRCYRCLWKPRNHSSSSIIFVYALLPSSSTSRSDIKFTGYQFSIGSTQIFYWQEECSSSSFRSRTFVYDLCMGSLAGYIATIHRDATEMTALSTAMLPIYAVVLHRAFGVAGGTCEGHSGCTVSSHLSLGFVMS